MKDHTDLCTVLAAAGAVAIAAVAVPSVAQASDIRGTVSFEQGAAIPQGRLEIYLEDPAVQDKTQRRVAETGMESDGKATAIPFALSGQAGGSVSPTLRIVARLERADGWLLARGSAKLVANSPTQVTLNTVMY